MRDKDFYKILEISREASPEEIKHAYRRLAIKYHPDTNHGGQDAEQHFKEINEAYSILGDAQKRKHYDLRGHDLFDRPHPQAGAYGFGACGFGKGRRCMGRGMAACFSGKAGGTGKAFRHPFSRYHNARGAVYDVYLTRDEALNGAEKVVDFGRNAGKIRIQTQSRLNDGDFLIIKHGNPRQNGEDLYLRVQLVD